MNTRYATSTVQYKTKFMIKFTQTFTTSKKPGPWSIQRMFNYENPINLDTQFTNWFF
jgi:hypothetical protein